MPASVNILSEPATQPGPFTLSELIILRRLVLSLQKGANYGPKVYCTQAEADALAEKLEAEALAQ